MPRKLQTVVIAKPEREPSAAFEKMLRTPRHAKQTPQPLTPRDVTLLTDMHNEIRSAMKRKFNPKLARLHDDDLIKENTRHFAFRLWSVHRRAELAMENGFTARIVDDRSGRGVKTVKFEHRK